MTDSSAAANFSVLPLPPALLNNLESLGYRKMTPIQAESLPSLLAGRDVIGQARTGSGKTAAFGLALLAGLDAAARQVQGLVLCPTRELADQVAGELRRLARSLPNIKVLTLCGGAPFGPQLASLSHGAHLVVGTPGRIDEHLRKGGLQLDGLGMLVLDEADRMLDMGFREAIEGIVAQTPSTRQTMLFSATFDEVVRAIAAGLMRDPLTVTVAEGHDQRTIREHFHEVADEQARFQALRRLLLQYQPESSVVFCNTRREVEEVANALSSMGFSALALHGELEQKDRDRRLILFANRSASILVATDVAARGLDVDALDAVFNYRIANDLEVHIHRVGRTGRAGSTGRAFTLFTPGEAERMLRLSELLGRALTEEPLPTPDALDAKPAGPPMVTLQIGAGKRQKLRPGDILGALTGDGGLAGAQIGKINVLDQSSYVAVNRQVAQQALAQLGRGKIKGRSFRARKVSS
ncbi:ATP-independent RNA helicase DbpA [Natronocella acetinitrilica]|uniref:ATP-independent RNA helicase DbpA n=1 Tax=Natronocella acetinitrilica TaxID=414046 RepID=A0AAE3G8R9_9GAMM|nr:ATP-dependent RNA helicase DbpA [Natronocella acetinitrilica]MCP1677099.1 ATP-independent RNA helicase DbpA [Natronocella acetinitrilica]